MSSNTTASNATALSNDTPLSSLATALPSDTAVASQSSVAESPQPAADHAAEEDDGGEEAEDDNEPPVNPLSDGDTDEDEDETTTTRRTADEEEVQLGFLDEPLHPRAMLRQYFPCKLGGKPAWLNPKHLPSVQQLTCTHCKNVMTFLLQLYTPLRSTFGSHPGSFHRTLYLFCCLEESCTNLQRSIVCFRSQLPRKNPFYPDTAPPKLEEWPLDSDEDQLPVWEDASEPGIHLCSVCGILAPSSCSKCHSRRYCSKQHQLYDWKTGGHKMQCTQRTPEEGQAILAKQYATASSDIQPSCTLPAILFPQKEIVIEPEVDEEDEIDGTKSAASAAGVTTIASSASSTTAASTTSDISSASSSSSSSKQSKEQQLLEAYEKQRKKEREAGEEEEDEEEIVSAAAAWASPKLKDPLFLKFKARTEAKPEQILRYNRASGTDATQPLWTSTWFQPASGPMPERAVDPSGKPIGPPPKPVAPTREENERAIPTCQTCGGKRRFEFQVLPQVLFYLGDSTKSRGLDFANLVVYTCEKSCGGGDDGSESPAYVEEFTWIQSHVPEPGLKNVQKVYGQ